jgi:hypothetical protein
VIDDSATGQRWLLVPDEAHPGGPGKMLLLRSPDADQISRERDGDSKSQTETARLGADAVNSRSRPVSRPVIRAGDALIVEEHTPVVDARLEAVALGSATLGAEFPARLKIGGKVVRVAALGPGRAKVAPRIKAAP